VAARFSAPFQTDCKVHPASCTMSVVSLQGVKRSGRGFNQPPPSSAEVKKSVKLNLYLISWLDTLLQDKHFVWSWSDIIVWHCFSESCCIQVQICGTVPSFADKRSCLFCHFTVAFILYHLDYLLSPCHTGMRLRVLSILYSPEENVRVTHANGCTPSSFRHSLLGFLYQ
jgi:hypothetical protein